MPEPGVSWFELPLVSVGGWLVTIVGIIWAMVSGRLIPRPVHEAIVADKDRQITDWRETARTEGARADLAIANQEKLLRGVETSNALIRSLPGASERNVS